MPVVLSDERLLPRMGFRREVLSFWSGLALEAAMTSGGGQRSTKTYLNFDQVRDSGVLSRFAQEA